MTLSDYIGQHPYVGAGVSLVHFVAGIGIKMLMIAPSDATLKWAQLGAFIIGMAAGVFTMYGVWKTHHGKKKKK